MKSAMLAIIKKDFRSVTSNKNLFASLLIVPIALTIVLPSVFVFVAHFTPNDRDVQTLVEMLPKAMQAESLELTAIKAVFNYIMPVFFLMIPIMAASIMAASSFVGEKERHTLETLLYCPLTVKEIFRSKVLASFLLSMFVSFLSFISMTVVLEIEVFLFTDTLLLPGVNWLVILLLVSPAISMIAITLIVRGSARAQSVEESQQSAVFLVIPIVLLAVGQFSGILLLSFWILLIFGAVCAGLAWILLKKCTARFTYETLLK